ncbi:MAG: SpoIIE family protein phosphatase [Bryobacteraceae bacterium]
MQETPNRRPEPGEIRILVSDDQVDVLEALRLMLKGAGYQTETVDSPDALLRAAGAGTFDLILMDMNYRRDTTSGEEGLKLLAELGAHGVGAPIVAMTAWAELELAVEAMRGGAADFVQKPWDNVRLLATIEKHTRNAKARRQADRRARSELEIARQVQEKLFPHNAKQLSTLDYSGCCFPAQDVGGDYYDFLDLGPLQLGIILGDVSGKGVAAALLMANLQALFRSQSYQATGNPEAYLQSVNRLFFESTAPEHYATLFFGVYDDSSRRLRFINCGHEPPLLARATGDIEQLDATATVLGAFRLWCCSEREIQLNPGDLLVIVSDGVTEAGIDGGEEFGERRLADLVRVARGEKALVTTQRIVDAARRFGKQGQNDDITVVALHVSA